MAYLSIGSDAQRVQLAVEELIVKSSDSAIVSTSGSNVSIDCQQTLASIVSAVHVKDGAASPLTVSAASQSVAGSVATLTLTAPLAANDAVHLCFKVVP